MKIDLKQILKDEANWKHENFGVVANFISGLGKNKDGVVELIDRENARTEPQPTPTATEGWEESFDNKIRDLGLNIGYKQKSRIEDLKSYISTLLAQTKETERARVRGIVKRIKIEYNNVLTDEVVCVPDLLKELK